MFYSKLVKKACNLAFDIHKEDKDRGDYPYILHPFYLATQMDDEYSTCVALLHDVIEDHGDRVSFDYLKAEGFPSEVIDALKLLTHKEEDTYFDYVKQIATNKIATKVKIADLMHNLDSSRIDGAVTKKKELYATALEYLFNVQNDIDYDEDDLEDDFEELWECKETIKESAVGVGIIHRHVLKLYFEYNNDIYKETLKIDRVRRTVEIVHKIDNKTIFSSKIKFSKEQFYFIVSELDSLLLGNSKVEEQSGKNSFLLKITLADEDDVTYSGDYNRRNVPLYFYSFMDNLGYIISNKFTTDSVIFDTTKYAHGKREGELIYCGVTFGEKGRIYHYLTDDDNIHIGDKVVVPVGESNEESIGCVKTINYYRPNFVPYPAERTKHIIRVLDGRKRDINPWLLHLK